MINAIKKTPLWKKFCEDIAEMAAEWISEFMKKEFQGDLMCALYVHMINKSEGSEMKSNCCEAKFSWAVDMFSTYTEADGHSNGWICDKCRKPCTPVEVQNEFKSDRQFYPMSISSGK